MREQAELVKFRSEAAVFWVIIGRWLLKPAQKPGIIDIGLVAFIPGQ